MDRRIPGVLIVSSVSYFLCLPDNCFMFFPFPVFGQLTSAWEMFFFLRCQLAKCDTHNPLLLFPPLFRGQREALLSLGSQSRLSVPKVHLRGAWTRFGAGWVEEVTCKLVSFCASGTWQTWLLFFCIGCRKSQIQSPALQFKVFLWKVIMKFLRPRRCCTSIPQSLRNILLLSGTKSVKTTELICNWILGLVWIWNTLRACEQAAFYLIKLWFIANWVVVVV